MNKRCAFKERCINPLGSELPATTEYFHANRATQDGLNIYCKVCWREYQRTRLQKIKAEKQTQMPEPQLPTRNFRIGDPVMVDGKTPAVFYGLLQAGMPACHVHTEESLKTPYVEQTRVERLARVDKSQLPSILQRAAHFFANRYRMSDAEIEAFWEQLEKEMNT